MNGTDSELAQTLGDPDIKDDDRNESPAKPPGGWPIPATKKLGQLSKPSNH